MENCISSLLKYKRTDVLSLWHQKGHHAKSQKGHHSYENRCKLTTLALDQLNMSKHVREKCGILCISSILCSKRGIIPTKIDAY